MLIAVDFDGTCVIHEFPHVGKDVPYAVNSLQRLAAEGHHLMLWTMRSTEYLMTAVHWFENRDVPLHSVNRNDEQWRWTGSPKAYAGLYIDDAAVGCPLIYDKQSRPYVDWRSVMKLIKRREGK